MKDNKSSVNFSIFLVILYIIGIAGLAISGIQFGYEIINGFDFSKINYFDIISVFLFIAAAIIFNCYTIDMPQEGKIVVTGGILFGSLLIFGKETSVFIAFLSSFIASIILKESLKNLFFKAFKNVICLLVPGWLIYLLCDLSNGIFFVNSIQNIGVIVLAIVLYLVLDTGLSSLFVSTKEGIDFRHVWNWHWGEIISYYILTIPMGVLIALFYRVNFPFSCIFIVIPFYILERINTSIKLKSFVETFPSVIQLEANKEVEDIISKTEQVRKELEKKNREIGILLQTSQELSTTLKLEETYEVIKGKIVQLFSCQTCIIFIIKQIEGEPQLEAETVSGPYTEFVLTVKSFAIMNYEVLAGWVAHEKKPCLITDTESQGDPPPMIRYERSEMAVPMLSQDECVGVIYVGQQKANSYTQDDLNLLSTLANQAAISITNAQLYEKTHNMATTDGLTGLFTHRTFQEKLEEEILKAQNYRSNMSMIMVDTDHFKEYNDTYGHPEGDLLLKEICKLLKSYVRKNDIVCRYGGDEFSLILVDADKQTAVSTAERIRQAIQLRLNQREVKITASIGVACYPEDASTKQEIIKKADESLYKSKRTGRNKVSYPQ